MIAATSLASSTLAAAAKRRIAASSVVPVEHHYEHSLRPCAARFSPAQGAIRSEVTA
jgi:hypothetical protein